MHTEIHAKELVNDGGWLDSVVCNHCWTYGANPVERNYVNQN